MQHMLYMLCDGHLGPEAADFVCMHLLSLIAPHVPPADPDAMSPKGVKSVDMCSRRKEGTTTLAGSVGHLLASVGMTGNIADLVSGSWPGTAC